MKPVSLLVCILCLSSASTAFADSPLTHPTFSSAYMDVPAVARARNGPSRRVFADLSNPSVSNDVRAAIVNALGWNVDGQDHAVRYAAYLATARGTALEQLRPADLAPHELFALGYMTAMDDYRFLRPMRVAGMLGQRRPRALLEAAEHAMPDDPTVALISALVVAQEIMAKSGQPVFCRMYRIVGEVVSRRGATHRPAALREITQYMDLYRSQC
jgi:hypothetical protein